MPPSPRSTLRPSVVSPTTPTQAPWRLQSAALAGSDSPSKMQQKMWLRPDGAGDSLTPHASTMQVAHARAEPAFSTTYGDIGRLRTPDSCWTECMLQDTACRLRSLRAYPIEFADTFPSTCPGAYTGFTGAYGDLRRSVRGISRSIRLPAQDFLLAVNLLALSDGVAKGCRYRPPEVIARPAALCRDRRSAQNPGPRSAARTPRCPGRAPRSGRRRPGCRRHRLREPPRAAVPDSRGRA